MANTFQGEKGLGQFLGMIVKKVYVSENQHNLWLDDGERMHYDGEKWYSEPVYHRIRTEADCCSETWFADIIGFKALIGEKINGIRILDLPTPMDDDRGRQEVDQAYGFELTTNKGACTIVYRNSSNGYYGGHIYDVTLDLGEDDLPSTVTEITDDWSA